MQALTKRLKQERELQQLSMRALAERMNKPHSYVQKVEQGERRLDVVEYVWYCHSLKLDPQVGLSLIQQTLAEKGWSLIFGNGEVNQGDSHTRISI